MAEKRKNKTKKVGVKNYIILLLLFATGIGLTMYFCNCYHVYDEYQKQTPIIRGSLSEITNEEIEHYILENPSTILYMCTSSDMPCRNFEKDFKKLIKKENLQESIIYLNLSDTNKKEFVENFNSKYSYKVKLTTNYPALIIFEEGRIKNILQSKKDKKLTISKAKQFIEINDIGE